MTLMRSVVLGCGSYLPERILTNEELARKVDTSNEWIVQRTGIRERHIAAPGELTSMPEGFEAPARSGELLLLIQCLERLAPKKREAFILMAIFELSAREAADVLGTFANTAASRFRHARSELHDLLSDVPELPYASAESGPDVVIAVRKERKAR